MAHNRLRIFATVISLLMLTSCGGGAGGGDANSPMQVTLSPTEATASFVSNDPNSSGYIPIPVTAKLSSIPAGSLYPRIIADKAVIKTGAQPIAKNNDGSYTVTLFVDPTIAAGVYQGTLTLQLCKDSACASQYALSGGTLPYTFTVTAALSVTMKVNGVSVVGLNGITAATSGKTFQTTVQSGATVDLISNIPVAWKAVVAGTTNAFVALQSSTPTSASWTVSGKTSSGYVGITAKPDDNRQVDASFMILVQ